MSNQTQRNLENDETQSQEGKVSTENQSDYDKIDAGSILKNILRNNKEN